MYEAVGPPHSFIHVDDFATLQELVDYMKEVRPGVYAEPLF
jgi:hypothetical protein